MEDIINNTFLHSVDLENSMLVHNLLVDGRLRTPNVLYEYEPLFKNNKTKIEDQSIENLKYLQDAMPSTFTPRAFIYVLAGATFRTGGNTNFGQMLKEEDAEFLTKDQIIRIADIELDFESKRRLINPNLVSRLSCFWLAEDNNIGKEMLNNMLGEKNRLIVRVKPLLDSIISRICKVDVNWYNKYCYTKIEKYIENYWKSIPSDNPQWEILYDGIIELIDKKDWQLILSSGKSFENQDYEFFIKKNRPDWL